MNFQIKQIAYIILISIFFSIIRYFFIQGEYPLIKRSEVSNASYESMSNLDSLKKYLYNIASPEIIDYEVAKKIYDNDLAIFLDARDNDSYNEEHIPGAINVPYEYVIEEIDYQFIKEILYEDLIKFSNEESDSFSIYEIEEDYFSITLNDSGFVFADSELSYEDYCNLKNIFVIYCSGPGCSLSEDLSMYLYENFQMNKILIYEGGMPEWNVKTKTNIK